jgi:hypothetical protein
MTVVPVATVIDAGEGAVLVPGGTRVAGRKTHAVLRFEVVGGVIVPLRT